jgi:hypothetical protein
MKFFLCVFLIFPFTFFSQNEIINKNIKIDFEGGLLSRLGEKREKQGTYYKGNGEYLIIEVGSTFRTDVDIMEEDALGKAEEIRISKGAFLFKKILSDKTKPSIGKLAEVKVTIQLLDESGNPFLEAEEVKEKAKKKLLELKQLKDEGIISQEEYDKAAEPHKKILLGL